MNSMELSAHQATGQGFGGSSGGGYSGSRASTSKDGLRTASSKDFFARPCYKKLTVDGRGCCAKWNWGVGCLTCAPSKEGEGCEKKLRHICSFCNGEHQVKDCTDYKRVHADDHALGYNGVNTAAA